MISHKKKKSTNCEAANMVMKFMLIFMAVLQNAKITFVPSLDEKALNLWVRDTECCARRH